MDSCGQIDVSIMQYIVQQKDIIIDELKDKIRILNNQIEILTQFNCNTDNSPANKHKEQKGDKTNC